MRQHHANKYKSILEDRKVSISQRVRYWDSVVSSAACVQIVFFFVFFFRASRNRRMSSLSDYFFFTGQSLGIGHDGPQMCIGEDQVLAGSLLWWRGAGGFSGDLINSKTICLDTDWKHPSGQRSTLRSGQGTPGEVRPARQC